ncbi:MAG TPA: DUF2726 domain-containing protein [Pseudomonadales bacterium]|nr:DUF2726 domain-containing protein [Pseudomonadales bacterium]
MTFLIVLTFLVFVAVCFYALKAAGAIKCDNNPSKKPAFSYVRRDCFFTAAERSFLQLLEEATGNQFRIFAHVRLGDLIDVGSGESEAAKYFQNRINSKHVDFVLCDASTLAIVGAIEIDDVSYDDERRKAREKFINDVLGNAKIPLIRFSALGKYSDKEVRALIHSTLGLPEEEPAPADQPSPEAPACPTCNGEMTIRTIKSGAHAGTQLWTCKSFPTCKGVLPVK